MGEKHHSVAPRSQIERWQSTMLGFLCAELKAARIFIELATKPANDTLKASYLGQAREACQTVADYSGHVQIMESEKERIHGELDSLKLRLEDLGVVIGGSDQLIDDGERSLLVSEHLRANAVRMRIQNRKLMNRSGHVLSKP